MSSMWFVHVLDRAKLLAGALWQKCGTEHAGQSHHGSAVVNGVNPIVELLAAA